MQRNQGKSRLRFCCAPPVAAPPAPGLSPCRAVIQLPVDLKRGQVLSPSYTITDADGGPPVGEVQVRLRINGVWAIPAIAVKCARLLMMGRLIGRNYATTTVPGTEKLPSLIPSAKLKHELAREAARQGARVAELKQQIQSLQSGKAGLKPGKLRSAVRSAQEELARTASEEAATNAVIKALNKGGHETQQAYESYMARSEAGAQSIANEVASTGTVPDAKVLDAMRKPAEMRTLKEASQGVQRAFNQTQTKIHSATNKDVVDNLQSKSPGARFRPGGVRTPGQSSLINTDNDAIFQKWIPKKGGGGCWKEVPASEWEADYNKGFAGHSGYSFEQAGGKSCIARGAKPTDPEKLKVGYKYKNTHGWEQGKGSFVVETEAMEQGVKISKLAKEVGEVLLLFVGPDQVTEIVAEVLGDEAPAPPWEEFALKTGFDRDTLVSRIRGKPARTDQDTAPSRRRFCTHCGQTLSSNALFCNQCGTRIEPPSCS